MTTDIQKCKEGAKLYAIEYFDSERKWYSYTVKKVKGNRIYLKGGYSWTSLSDLGDSVFLSKEDAIKNTLNLHKEKLEEIEEEELKPIRKEIKYLEKKLYELTK